MHRILIHSLRDNTFYVTVGRETRRHVGEEQTARASARGTVKAKLVRKVHRDDDDDDDDAEESSI